MLVASVIDQSLDRARDWPPGVVAALGALAAFLLVFAIGVHLAARRLRRELEEAQEELVDPATGLLPRSALAVRLGAELSWADTTGTPISVAAVRVRGSGFEHAAHVLRRAMRGEEQAFLLGDQRVAVELWGTDVLEAAGAARRLVAELAAAGHTVVDVGVAGAPRDGNDPAELVSAALRDMRPVDDANAPGHLVARSGHAPGRIARQGSLAGQVLVWLGAAALLLAASWRLVERGVHVGASGHSAGDTAAAVVAVVGIPLAAALLAVAAWNRQGGPAPWSHPVRAAGWWVGAIIAAAIAAPLAWGLFASADSGSVTAVSVAALALVVLALASARQLVHAAVAPLVVILAVGWAGVWAFVHPLGSPVAADVARLVAAAAAGSLLAKLIERLSWLVGVVALAGVLDLWSVLADRGVTHQLLEGGTTSRSALDLLLFTGPAMSRQPAFELGSSDLVVVALVLAACHDWRVDMRAATAALATALWATVVVVDLTDRALPALPAVAVATIALLGLRSLAARRRTSAASEPLAQPDPHPDPDPEPVHVPVASI